MTNEGNQSFECYICDTEFTIVQGIDELMNEHMATQVGEGEETLTYYTCKDCNAILASHENQQ